MSGYSGDFLGFQLGDIHSSSLNITRVSVSDRYEENLLPKMKDIVVENPGGDGTYYFNTYYNQREFVISFAYDDLRDEDIRRLKQVLGAKKIQPLIFDESTYKKYMVKASSAPSLSYIPFQHKEVTVYKGEGEVVLTAYYPYGIGTYSPEITNLNKCKVDNNGDLPALLQIKYLFADALQAASTTISTDTSGNGTTWYPIGNGTNIVWLTPGAGLLSNGSSGLLSTGATGSDLSGDEGGTTSTSTTTTNSTPTYNYKLVLAQGDNERILELTDVRPADEDDVGFIINCKTHLIEGIDASGAKTGNLYNKYITKGSFFSAPVGISNFTSTQIFASFSYTPLYY